MIPQGDFLWYELMTPDVAAAQAFYGPLLGWSFREAEGEMPYTLALSAAQEVAGIMAATGEMPTAWVGYIAVDDAAATLAALQADGARAMVPVKDIPGVGRIAGILDPQGAAVMLMQAASEGGAPAFDTAAVGHVNWNELAVPDPVAGLAFYTRHFGWTAGYTMPMGELGDYQMIDHAGRTIGAVMGLVPPRPPSFLFYFGVPGIDTATAGVTAGGGTVIAGPMPIPGDMFVTVALDPQGAAFALVGPKG